VILPDTSVWVEYLRATESPSHLRLQQLIANDVLRVCHRHYQRAMHQPLGLLRDADRLRVQRRRKEENDER